MISFISTRKTSSYVLRFEEEYPTVGDAFFFWSSEDDEMEVLVDNGGVGAMAKGVDFIAAAAT